MDKKKNDGKEQGRLTPCCDPIAGQPENSFELINKYGTYNIQPTAEADNDYPEIAQGISDEEKRHRAKEVKEWEKSQQDWLKENNK